MRNAALDLDGRLPFTLPDFTRISWVSDELRERWESRLQRITAAFSDIEWRAINAGVRTCALTVVTPETLIERAAEWAAEGLAALPLELQGLANYYASTGRALEYGRPVGLRVVIGTPRDVAQFKKAFDAADDVGIGRLLGYPECCQAFFRATWVDRKMVDTTWSMAVNTPGGSRRDATVEVRGPIEANILWRWMGVRAVPHLPCRFDCEATVKFGRTLIDVGRSAGHAEEMTWLEEILSWPAEWSTLHGIAEIKTPLVRVSTRSDATAAKHTVRRLSDSYPDGGVKALVFPFKVPKQPLLTSATHFRRGLDNEIKVATPKPSWYAKDNGFQSIISMENAHRPIVDLASALLGRAAGNVLDLGCGNGALLMKIVEANAAAVPFGIENDPARLAHVSEVLPAFAANLIGGDMFGDDRLWPEERRYAVALLMPGRLIEAAEPAAEALREKLKTRCDHVLVYAYGDWLTRYGDLRGLARESGLELLNVKAGAAVALAKIP